MSIRGREIWAAARERTAEQIGTLRERLSGMPDPDLQRLATFDLNGTTSERSAALLTALSEVDGAAPDRQPDARAKARRLISEFSDYLKMDALTRVLDDNPLKEPVAIRETLGAALAEIDQTLVG